MMTIETWYMKVVPLSEVPEELRSSVAECNERCEKYYEWFVEPDEHPFNEWLLEKRIANSHSLILVKFDVQEYSCY